MPEGSPPLRLPHTYPAYSMPQGLHAPESSQRLLLRMGAASSPLVRCQASTGVL